MKKIITIASVLGAFLSTSFQNVSCMGTPSILNSDTSSPEILLSSQPVTSEDSCSSEGCSPTVVSEDFSDAEEFSLQPNKKRCFHNIEVALDQLKLLAPEPTTGKVVFGEGNVSDNEKSDDDFPGKIGMKRGRPSRASGHEKLATSSTEKPEIIVEDVIITTAEEFDEKLHEKAYFRARLPLTIMSAMFESGFDNRSWGYYGTCMGASKENVINVIALNEDMLEGVPYKDGEIRSAAISQIDSENNNFLSSVFVISSHASKEGEESTKFITQERK